MFRFTFSIGNWIIFHIILFARGEQDSGSKIDLTDIGGSNILADDAEDDELLAKRRPFGFGRRN
jgi:hypothetical protein